MLFWYDLYLSACAQSKSLHRMPFGSARKSSFNETSEMIYASLHARGENKKNTGGIVFSLFCSFQVRMVLKCG